MEFLKSQKGGKILVYEGYRYRRDKLKLNSTTWRCTEVGCKGRLIVSNNSAKPTTAHTHGPEPSKTEVLAYKNQLKSVALSTTTQPKAIMQQCLSTSIMSMEATVSIPNYEATRKTVQRIRQTTGQKSVSFASIDEIEISDAFAKTETGDQFLLWDSKIEEGSRIIMFGTNANLNLLQEFPNWAMDGTFKVVPQFFSQLYTIHALVDNKAIPILFVLLQDKRYESYIRMLNKIKELKQNLSPHSILIDFEQAAIKAINHSFPDIDVVGCNFHLAQSLWRRIQQLGMTEEYRSREEIRLCSKMLLGLTFVPEKDVQFSLEIIKEDFPPEMAKLVDYWETTYVGRRILGIQPRFPIKIWNMHERILNTDLPKTNNSLEAWHNAFQKTLDCYHPNILRLIGQFKIENNYTNFIMDRFRAGERKSPSSNAKYAQQKKRIKVLIQNYKFIHVKEFLKAVALNLSL